MLIITSWHCTVFPVTTCDSNSLPRSLNANKHKHHFCSQRSIYVFLVRGQQCTSKSDGNLKIKKEVQMSGKEPVLCNLKTWTGCTSS